MDITESEAAEWLELHGVSDSSWDSLPSFQKGMVGIEAVASSWDEVDSIRETGVPESAAVLYFNSEKCGLNEAELEFQAEEGDLSLYVMQNAESEALASLFDDSAVSVLGVDLIDGSNDERYVLVECEAGVGLFD